MFHVANICKLALNSVTAIFLQSQLSAYCEPFYQKLLILLHDMYTIFFYLLSICIYFLSTLSRTFSLYNSFYQHITKQFYAKKLNVCIHCALLNLCETTITTKLKRSTTIFLTLTNLLLSPPSVSMLLL